MLTGPALDIVVRNVVQGQETANHVDTEIVIFEKGFYCVDSTTGKVVVPYDNANHIPLGFALNYWPIGSNPTTFRWDLQVELTLKEGTVASTAWGTSVYAESDDVFTLDVNNRPRVGKIVEILDADSGRVVVQVSMELLN